MAGFTLVRARDEFGRFVPDDPATPDVDEAWVAVPQVNDSSVLGEG